ncbi:MAG: DEAD/DEAH box helicase, partial [Terracoccus sp.]
ATWAREAARFTPELTVTTISATERRSGLRLADAVAGAHVVVTSYALFRIEADSYHDLLWDALVLDEAQFVKNHQSRTYQVARRLRAPVKLAITGTPLENSLMDLWALLSIVAPGLFPNPQRFSELFRRPIESGDSPELLATLRRRIRPLMLRRTKEAVAPDLPPKIEQVVAVPLNPAHRRIYDTHLQRERQRILGLLGDVDRNRIAILTALTKLRQLSLDVHLVAPDAPASVRSSKVDALLDQLVEVAAEGHRCLVFSQFTRFLHIVRNRLTAEGIDHIYLDGRTRDRPKRIAAFTDGAAPVFLISLKAGGSGLTLTEADYVFVLDPWWNPAVEAQAIDRTHRIGQDKTVMVYRLVSEGTIEEKVVALQERKRELFSRVVDEGGRMGAPLTADDIRGLLEG